MSTSSREAKGASIVVPIIIHRISAPRLESPYGQLESWLVKQTAVMVNNEIALVCDLVCCCEDARLMLR